VVVVVLLLLLVLVVMMIMMMMIRLKRTQTVTLRPGVEPPTLTRVFLETICALNSGVTGVCRAVFFIRMMCEHTTE